VRKHAPFESPIKVYLKPSQPGSFDTLYQIISVPGAQTVIGNLVLSLTGDLLYDALKMIFNQVTGRGGVPEQRQLKELARQRGGDLAALEDAVEPSLVHAHRVIGNGSNSIVIIGNNNKIVFDNGTKEFITTSIDDDKIEVKQVSVASYNVNTKSGRVYDFEFERTIPFALSSAASNRSAVAIARCLTQYTGGEDSKVAITYSKVLAPDGKVKKYIVKNASRPAREI
jgi:hypothetical protein